MSCLPDKPSKPLSPAPEPEPSFNEVMSASNQKFIQDALNDEDTLFVKSNQGVLDLSHLDKVLLNTAHRILIQRQNQYEEALKEFNRKMEQYNNNPLVVFTREASKIGTGFIGLLKSAVDLPRAALETVTKIVTSTGDLIYSANDGLTKLGKNLVAGVDSLVTKTKGWFENVVYIALAAFIGYSIYTNNQDDSSKKKKKKIIYGKNSKRTKFKKYKKLNEIESTDEFEV